jgi:hypothetical protein
MGILFTDLTMRISRNKPSEAPELNITTKTLNKTRGYGIVADDDKTSAQLVLKKHRESQGRAPLSRRHAHR